MTQYELSQRVVSAGVNIVTCGHCGSVLLHETGTDSITCPHCTYESDPSDFPDLFINEPDSYYLVKE